MAGQAYVEFTPSFLGTPQAKRLGPLPAQAPVEISVYLLAQPVKPGLDRQGIARAREIAHAPGLARIRAFAQEHGLEVLEEAPARRLVRLRGPAAAMQQAFKTELHRYHDGKHEFHGRSGALHLPADMAEMVEAVLGLDQRRIAEPRFIIRPAAQQGASYLPNQVAGFYGFPTDITGAGECIGLIELGGGFTPADTQAAFAAMGLTPPLVVAVPVDGGANTPQPDDGADGEVALDIQVAGGAAPGAKIAVYFTPNTDAGFVDAITAATHDAGNAPSVLSISWGSPERNWAEQALSAMTSALRDAASLGLSVFVAAGDNLATDGQNDGQAQVDFPASSPWACGCGGTRITVQNGAVAAETVWNEGSSGTGGGISEIYPVPSFQSSVKLPPNVSTGGTGRGVPDVAGNADPNSGYVVVVSGQGMVVGGTSAVAPLWAGLAALANQAAGKPSGFFPTKLYANAGALRQITNGNNMPAGSDIGYMAGPGWNACTGLGVPRGAAVVALFASQKVS
jgi:kumamolisin